MIADKNWLKRNLRRNLSSLVDRATDSVNGISLKHKDKIVDAKYRMRKSTLIAKLMADPGKEVDPQLRQRLMPLMSALIDDEEKGRRRSVKRKAIAADARATRLAEKALAEEKRTSDRRERKESKAFRIQSAVKRAEAGEDLDYVAAQYGISLRTLRRRRQAVKENGSNANPVKIKRNPRLSRPIYMKELRLKLKDKLVEYYKRMRDILADAHRDGASPPGWIPDPGYMVGFDDTDEYREFSSKYRKTKIVKLRFEIANIRKSLKKFKDKGYHSDDPEVYEQVGALFIYIRRSIARVNEALTAFHYDEKDYGREKALAEARSYLAIIIKEIDDDIANLAIASENQPKSKMDG